MARVSSTVTPDLLLTDRYNQQNMYNIKDVDPGGGEEEFEEDSRNEVFNCNAVHEQGKPKHMCDMNTMPYKL